MNNCTILHAAVTVVKRTSNDHLNDLVYILCKQNQCFNSHTISTEHIRKGVKFLKSNKKDGSTGHNSNHIIHGTSLLFEMLSKLLSSMLLHGYAPPDLRLSVIIPIVKNKHKSVNKSTNYRGIALSSIIAKLMDIIIMEKESSVIQSSDFQFGFKEKSSTTQCTFVMNEVIQYYMNNAGTVYAAHLDASKAFDSVKFDKLFELLIERKMCPLTARFLAFVYMNQSCCLKWGSSVSRCFSARNGVKQGGVLSPQLFNIYLDVLLDRLNKSGYGCHIGQSYMGSFAYADDIVLLSPTITSLNSQLKVCESYSNEFNIHFNAEKSKLLVYGSPPTSVHINFQGHIIKPTSYEKHVGILVGNRHDVHERVIQEACNNLYGRLNLLIRQFGNTDTFVLYYLFNTYCLSFYGSQLYNLSSAKTLEPLYVAWRKCVRKILKVPSNTHCDLLPLICEDNNIAWKLHKRFLKFIANANKSHNQCINLCMKLAAESSMSVASESWKYLCSVYSFNRFDMLCFTTANLSIPEAKECDRQKAGLIHDLVIYRDRKPDPNVQVIIDQLCTE